MTETRMNIAPRFGLADHGLARAIVAGGDTAEHLPFLRALAERPIPRPVVVEMGVRGVVTTWAFLAARPAALVSVDLAWPPAAELDAARAAAVEAGVAFDFVLANTLDLEPIPCDVLFIDTLHTYAQLRAELDRHAGKVSRFIALHDTETYGYRGEDGTEPGLRAAVQEFLEAFGEERPWRVVHDAPECNGLVVLERVR